MSAGHLDRLRIYLVDERHIYKGSHQTRRVDVALAYLELVANDLATLRARVEELEASRLKIAVAAREWGFVSADRMHVTNWADWPALNRLFRIMNEEIEPTIDEGEE